MEVTMSCQLPAAAEMVLGREPEIRIRPFQPGDEPAFRRLNEAWITKHFGATEEADRAILGDPWGKVINPGGQILLVVVVGEAIACCALVPMEPGVFELAKMAVTERCQGRGIGRKLLEHTVAQARALGAHKLCLETNSKLENAIHLYETVGFRHLPPERRKPSPYSRSNVQMALDL
jgi:GNAT superfamily N-acetyltransferase